MASIIEETTLQNDLHIILIFEIKYETEIKVYHVYQNIWSPELSEKVQCESENPIDKYAVQVCCVLKNDRK